MAGDRFDLTFGPDPQPRFRPLEIQEKPEFFPHALDAGAQRADLQTGEVRVVDAKTGGEKGQKLERFDLIPVMFWRCLARLFGKGAIKYADRNWEKGYSWGLSIGALQRHLAYWLSHQSYDTADGTKGGPIEFDANGKPIHTGEHHLICVAWHCCVLFSFETRKLGTDDRAPTVEV